jgi:hypothetical protein
MERSAVVVKAEARGQLYHAMVSPPVGRGVKERYAFLWRSPAQPTFSRLIEGSRPAWSPDGSEICFAREGDIWKVAIDGGTPILLLKSDAGAAWPRWSVSAIKAPPSRIRRSVCVCKREPLSVSVWDTDG